MSPWRQIKKGFGIFVLLLTAFGLSLIGSHGTSKTVQAQGVDQRKRFEGGNLKFNVPDDWPIEERGGTVGPIPVEEYLALKFSKIEARFKTIDASLAEYSARMADFDSRLKAIEDRLPDIEQRLTDLEDWLKRGQARRLN